MNTEKAMKKMKAHGTTKANYEYEIPGTYIGHTESCKEIDCKGRHKAAGEADKIVEAMWESRVGRRFLVKKCGAALVQITDIDAERSVITYESHVRYE